MPLAADDWFARNADRRNPNAAIRRDPPYFADECASAIANGTLVRPYRAPEGRVPPDNFCRTLSVNVDNDKLSDAEFREFVRNSLPVVDFAPAQTPS